MTSGLRLSVVGSSPAMPRPGGACSSYLVRANDTAVLLDIGNGALGKLHLALEYARLDAVVISHVHADHFFDIVPLRQGLKYDSPPLVDPMPLWLPPGGAAALDALRKAVTPEAPADFFSEVFSVSEYDPAQPLRIKDLELRFAPTCHYIPGYAMRANYDGESITYSSDTAPSDSVVELARGSTLFVCEAALGLGSEGGQRGHSSAPEAGEMANRAGVRRLALTHYSASWEPEALVEAAASRFNGPVTVVDDGMEIRL